MPRKLTRLLMAALILIGALGLRATPAYAVSYGEEFEIRTYGSTELWDYTWTGENVKIFANYPTDSGCYLGHRWSGEYDGQITISTLSGININRIEMIVKTSSFGSYPHPDHGRVEGYTSDLMGNFFSIEDVNSPTVTITRMDEDSSEVYGQVIIHWAKVYYERGYQTVEAPQAIEGLVYNGEPQDLVTEAVVVEGNTDAGSITYSVDQIVWDNEVPALTDAGDFEVYYKVKPTSYYFEYVCEEPVHVSIAQAKPERPTGLTATVGQHLRDIKLPERWSWYYRNTELTEDDIGDHEYMAYYDSPDHNHISALYYVTVTVKPKPESSEEPETATLAFDLGGGTLDGKTGKVTVEASVGDTIKLPGAPTREGYTFKYWKGSQYAAGAEYKVEGDHSFTAVWEKKTSSKQASGSSKSGSSSPKQASPAKLPSTGDPAAAACSIAAAGMAALAAAGATRGRRRRG